MSSAAYDILMVTDCRFPGGNTSSVVEEIRAQHRAGYRTGLLHVPSPVLGKPRPFASKITGVLDDGLAELVLDRTVDCKLLLARHPTVFSDPPDDLPEIRADEILLAVNQVPADARSGQPYYDVPQVQHQIERVLGHGAIWAPIGPRVREALAGHEDTIRLLHWDWENVIDVDQWRVPRDSFVSDRPVIGRHSRGHWTKWPDDPADIIAAYPNDPRYSVRILGGAESPAKTLGGMPANWVDLPFNSIPAQQFLSGIDFFVYFHHPGLIEAFGRVVLEALSAGVVAIVPRYLEPLFGDVCLYGEPRDVRRYVDQLYADWDAFAARSVAGVAMTQRRFSYDTHLTRVRELIGEPSGRPAEALTRRKAAPEVSLIIDVSAEERPELLRSVAKVAGGRCVALVPARRASAVSELAAVETVPRVVDDLRAAHRRRYLEQRVDGLVVAHRPSTVLLLDDGDAPRVSPVSGAAVLRLHRGVQEPGAEDDPLIDKFASSLPKGWTASLMSPGKKVGANPGQQRQRRELPPPLRLRTRARRKVRVLQRERLDRLIEQAPSVGLALFEADEAEFTLPVAAKVTHPRPEQLPVVLVVVTGDEGAADVVRALVARQQITSGFRVALLAPAGWEAVAATYDMTTETLLSQADWASLHGNGGWREYLAQRVSEVCAVIQPVTVACLDGPGGLAATLEVLEASRTRPRYESGRPG